MLCSRPTFQTIKSITIINPEKSFSEKKYRSKSNSKEKQKQKPKNLGNKIKAIKKENTKNNEDILQNKEPKIITINPINFPKCKLNSNILKNQYFQFCPSKTSKREINIIKSYSTNTYKGLIRNYNEDKVCIIINYKQPNNICDYSFFSIYDGHGGNGCSEYLRDNLHKLIINDINFPKNIEQSIKNGFEKAEKDFLSNYALSKDELTIIDKSGSCALIMLIIKNILYIANVGDSRGIASINNGQKYISITEDHRPNSKKEEKRIINNGGFIYQSQTLFNKNISKSEFILGPLRVMPGSLSVSRTIGDIQAKNNKFGGLANVIIAEPDIFVYDLSKEDFDFIILGCDGIYEKLSNKELIDGIWMIINDNKDKLDIHQLSGKISDFILKAALARKSLDNVTCVFVCFKNFKKSENKKSQVNNKELLNKKLNKKKAFGTLSKKSLKILNEKITKISNNKLKKFNTINAHNKENKNKLVMSNTNIINNSNNSSNMYSNKSYLFIHKKNNRLKLSPENMKNNYIARNKNKNIVNTKSTKNNKILKFKIGNNIEGKNKNSYSSRFLSPTSIKTIDSTKNLKFLSCNSKKRNNFNIRTKLLNGNTLNVNKNKTKDNFSHENLIHFPYNQKMPVVFKNRSNSTDLNKNKNHGLFKK